MRAIARWMLAALACLGLSLVLGLVPAPAAAAPTATGAPVTAVPIRVALKVDNVYRFSSREKTFSAEGTLRLSAPAATVRQWLAAELDLLELVRFQNLVEPWDSLLEASRGPLRLGPELGRDYRFNGNFYSDEIDDRGVPLRHPSPADQAGGRPQLSRRDR